MSIQEHFQQSVIEVNGVEPTDEEAQELFDYLDVLIEMQKQGMSDNDREHLSIDDRIRNIAGLAFVAGRSYQHEQDEEIADEAVHDQVDEVEERERRRLARNILEAATYLLGE